MTTWANFLSELREIIDDNSDSPRYTDELLYMYTKDAVRDYSTHFPRRIDRLEMVYADGSYALPSDFVDDLYVESPQDRFLERRNSVPGRRYGSPTRPLYYYVSGGSLYLSGSPYESDAVLLTYFATHEIPASQDDQTFVFTIPDRDIELPRLYVKAMVTGQMRSKQSKQDRFKPAGRRDDNPLMPETMSLMDEYHMKINARLGGKAIRLYRQGMTR